MCTNLAFYLSNVSLKQLSAFTSNLILNLEPLYGIILGALIFQENKQLNREFYVGTTIILLAVLLGPFIGSPEQVQPEPDLELERGTETEMSRLSAGTNVVSASIKHCVQLNPIQWHRYKKLEGRDLEVSEADKEPFPEVERENYGISGLAPVERTSHIPIQICNNRTYCWSLHTFVGIRKLQNKILSLNTTLNRVDMPAHTSRVP